MLKLKNKFIMKKYYIYVACCFTLIGCTKLEDPKEPIGIDDVFFITYKNNDSTLVADSSDVIEINAVLNKNNVTANKLVTFTTEQGTFVGASGNKKSISVTADGYNAKVILRSDNIVNDKVQLTVTVGDFILYPRVSFIRSYPEEILISPSKFTLNADMNDKVYFTANLKKAIGVVSQGTKVEFVVQNITGAPDVYIQPIYWKETSLNRAEMVTTSTVTGTVRLISRVLKDGIYINSQDTLNINVQ